MGDKTKIQWTEATWTPIRARPLFSDKIGWHCEHVSEGCRNCYAESLNKRLGTGLDFKPGHKRDLKIFLDEKMLMKPLHWKKPRMIFVCSMTDLFADFVEDEWLDKMFAVMALCPHHTFQILTKRPARMRGYLESRCSPDAKVSAEAEPIRRAINAIPNGLGNRRGALETPLPNVWLGTSTEDQAAYDERLPELMQTPAAVRFLSIEPLIGPIVPDPESLVDWIIIGGESGPHARVCRAEWIRDIVGPAKSTGVAIFVKQLGARFVDEKNGIAGRMTTVPDEVEITRRLKDAKGGDIDEWPDFRIREMPGRS